MIRSLDEFKKDAPTTAKAAERLARTAIALETIAREEVHMEAVTKDPAWDHFLSYLAAAHKAATRHRDVELAKLRDPFVVNGDEIAICKAKITRIDARIETLDEIMKLPKFIKEHAQRASEIIAQMTRDAA